MKIRNTDNFENWFLQVSSTQHQEEKKVAIAPSRLELCLGKYLKEGIVTTKWKLQRNHIYQNITLNCPCHLYGSALYHAMHNWAPFIWYTQKCMLIWKNCFYFSFDFAICSSEKNTRHVTRDRFTEKVLSRWDNFQLARFFHILWLGIGRK